MTVHNIQVTSRFKSSQVSPCIRQRSNLTNLEIEIINVIVIIIRALVVEEVVSVLLLLCVLLGTLLIDSVGSKMKGGK